MISVDGWPLRATVGPAGSDGENFRLTAAGEFDSDNGEVLGLPVRMAIMSGYTTVTVDFAKVTFIDASVIGILISCQKLAARHGSTLRIHNPSGMPALVLDLTGTREALCGPD